MDQLLQISNATSEFKAAVQAHLEGADHDRIEVAGWVPHVKIRRLLTQLLDAEGELPIERVVINGSSGCSDFVGSVQVHTAAGPHVIDFVWDCRWRAMNEGYVDYFGFPDQIRAAQEFDWRCFQLWQRRDSGHLAADS